METSFQPLGVGVGSIINGRYELMRKLGSGAMSAVYQVADHALNRDIIALKLFAPSINDDKTLVERIHNEVIITRKLNAPHIARTYDFGRTKEGLYYMTMEYIEGVTLDRLIHRNDRPAPSFRDIVRILRDVAAGISFAHTNGIIHRDLKPANIIISLDGDVKIADFGLARALNLSHDLTRAGECVGTPYYMAPEQIQDTGMDGRTDIYALGIIAFELVCGCVPFNDKNWFNLAKMIITQPLPAVEDYAKVPKWYSEFVRKAAAKLPQDRFQHAEEIVGYLSEKLEQGDLSAEYDNEARLSRVLSHLGKSLGQLAPVGGGGSTIPAVYLMLFGMALLGVMVFMLISSPSGRATIQENIQQGTSVMSNAESLLNQVKETASFVVNNREAIAETAKQLKAKEQDEAEKKKAAPEDQAVKPDIP